MSKIIFMILTKNFQRFVSTQYFFNIHSEGIASLPFHLFYLKPYLVTSSNFLAWFFNGNNSGSFSLRGVSKISGFDMIAIEA